MSIAIKKVKSMLYLVYEPENDVGWIRYILNDIEVTSSISVNQKNSIWLRRTFNLYIEDYVPNTKLPKILKSAYDYDEDYPIFVFKIGEIDKSGTFYQIYNSVLNVPFRVNIALDVNIDVHLFYKNRVSIFKQIAKIYKNEQLFVVKKIEEDKELGDTIEEATLRELVENTPNTHEVNLYKENRIAKYVEDYLDISDTRGRLQKYLNRKLNIEHNKTSIEEANFKINDIAKFEYLRAKLITMLNDPSKYIESVWQKEIIAVFKYLYPQYIYVGEKLKLKSLDGSKILETDVVLVDVDGNVDLIEVKRPDEFIQYKAKYRDLYIPTKNLVGTAMQIQNYLTCMIKTNTEDLNHFKIGKPLIQNLVLKANSPKGFIIFGLDKYDKEDKDRLRDFYTVRRMFTGIIDVITYDDLIRRLDNLIESLKQSI